MLAAMEPQAQPIRYLDRDGQALVALSAFAHDPRTLIAFYRAMLRTRTFDAKAVALQRTGRLGTYASSLGEEAVGVGLASAMRPGARHDLGEHRTHQVGDDLAVGERAVDPGSHRADVALAEARDDRRASELAVGEREPQWMVTTIAWGASPKARAVAGS